MTDIRRRVTNLIARTLVYCTAVLALIPLALVLIYTISNGLPAIEHLDFFINSYRPITIPGAGIFHAIVGTLSLVAMASLLAIPVGIVAGVNLAEYSRSSWAPWVRLAGDVLVGTPSIAVGLFVYTLLVAPTHQFSAISGSIALAVLMLPIVMRTTEGALTQVPNALRESGLALGMPRWRVAAHIMLTAGAPGVVTGALLAVSRAAGETAPLLFTSFGNQVLNLDPTRATAALPLIVYKYALTPYPALVQEAWGAALVLILLALAINLGSRLALRRWTANLGG